MAARKEAMARLRGRFMIPSRRVVPVCGPVAVDVDVAVAADVSIGLFGRLTDVYVYCRGSIITSSSSSSSSCGCGCSI